MCIRDSYNPILNYGEERFIQDAAKAGANGFIIVDLPPEEALKVRNYVNDNGLSLIPLVAPSTTDERLELLSHIADSFVYVVSRMGTTGVQSSVASDPVSYTHLDVYKRQVLYYAGLTVFLLSLSLS